MNVAITSNKKESSLIVAHIVSHATHFVSETSDCIEVLIDQLYRDNNG